MGNLFLFSVVDDDVAFLQGMLEGMTNIEAEAYSQLGKMGASKLKKVAVRLLHDSCFLPASIYKKRDYPCLHFHSSLGFEKLSFEL